ncbi:MAG: sigma-70 family RNA polymerase sigma factor [Bacteroidales bacterium]|nr:sigma-70 family RNA polymerase sigma factor [Bacteroidales bacterium]
MEDIERQLYDKFDNLISKYGPLIERLCIRFASGDEYLCAELRQVCYICIWHYLPNLRAGSNNFQERAFVVWHCRSVFSHRRYSRLEIPFQPLDKTMEAIASECHDNDARIVIDELAMRLNPHERRAFLLMAEGYGAKEIAIELGIKHRSAVILKHRIMVKLRRYVNEKNNEGKYV